MKKILVTSSKGGEGKTTTTINLGSYLFNQGYKVAFATCDTNQTLSQKIKCIYLSEETGLAPLKDLDVDYLLIDTGADYNRNIIMRLFMYVDHILFITSYGEFSSQQVVDFVDNYVGDFQLKEKVLGFLPNRTKYRKVFAPDIRLLEELAQEINCSLFSPIPDLIHIPEAIKLDTHYFEYLPENNKAIPYIEKCFEEVLSGI